MNDRDRNDQPTEADEIEPTQKPGGLGDDGTIPADPDGIAAGHTDEESNFNQEEDTPSEG